MSFFSGGQFMKNLNILVIVAAVLMVLGIVADFTGAFGIPPDTTITVRWLFAEVVVSSAVSIYDSNEAKN